ncbi:MAG: hypothetical protein R3E48_04855 [Burkholderiaceae bacterium]
MVHLQFKLFFPARLLNETDRIPCATVHLAPAVFRSNLNPARAAPNWITAQTPSRLKQAAWWLLDKTFCELYFTAPLNRFRAELGRAADPGRLPAGRRWRSARPVIATRGLHPGRPAASGLFRWNGHGYS